MINYIIALLIILIIGLFISGFKIIRPTQKALVERFGKFYKYCNAGLTWIIPFVDQIIIVDITETLVDAQPQEIITKDKLNAVVDAQVYFKIKSDQQSVCNSQYNVNNCRSQIVSLARTTLRNIIGTMTLNDANSDRDKINSDLLKALSVETNNWGIEIVRTELKEINPPKEVQETMNKVVIAENEKQSAIDFATATETRADGQRRANIKSAEGLKQASILEAQGIAESKIIVAKAEAERLRLVNESANKYFVGNAQLLRKLDVVESSLKDNSKIILSKDGISPQLIIGDLPLVNLKKNKDGV